MARSRFPLALLGLAACLASAAGDAAARTRQFCEYQPYYGGLSRSCGGHLEPACTSGEACDPGFTSYAGAPFPITIDCPTIKDPVFGTVIVDIPDVQVASGCYDTRPDCSACGGPDEPPCPAATSPWCSVGCEAGLEPDPTTTLCRTPGTPGSPCGPGYGCGPGLACDLTQLQCVAEAQAGESCANPFVGCAPGLTCTAALECAHSPAQLGETCDAITGVSCGSGLFCKAGLPQRCHAKRKPGEACGPGAPCMDGTSCLACPAEGCDAAFQCFPDPDFTIPGTSAPSIAGASTQSSELLTPASCPDMYSVKQGRKAEQKNAGLTIGIGAEAALIAGASAELGVAYGSQDEFGCYRTLCQGINIDAAIEAFAALSEVDTYADIAGQSAVLFEEVQVPYSVANVAAGQIWAGTFDNLGAFLGTSWAFSVGIGPNPLPFSAGQYDCETTLTDFPTVASVQPGVSAPAEPASDPVDVPADSGAAAAVFVPGTGALYFDGVDDALAVSDPSLLAALDLVTPEHLAWRADIDRCLTTPIQVPSSLGGCSLVGSALLWPTESECVAGEFKRRLTYDCPFPLPDLSQEFTATVPGGPGPGYGDGHQLTLEAWVRPDVGALQGMVTLLRKEGEYELVLADGELAWSIAYSQGGTLQRTGYALPLGVWTHVAVVYEDGSGVRTYANGQPVHWAEAAGEVVSTLPDPGALWLGARPGASEEFAGQLDAVRVWARALTQAEIREGLDVAPGATSPGLLASWDFSERAGAPIASDRGPRGVDLVLDGLGASQAPLRTAEDRTRPGGALAFDGRDDHVAVTDPAALQGLAVSDALSVEAWVRPTGPGSHPTFGGVIASKEGEWWLGRAPDGRVNFALADASPGWVTRTSDVVLPENAWSHLTLTYDAAAGQVSLFLNGALAYTESATGALGDHHPGLDQLRIGGRQLDDTGANQRFQGLIDEVRVWSVALSPSAVAAQWDAPVPPGAMGLLGDWRFDEGPTGVAFDASPGRRHALLGAGRIVESPARSDALAFADYPSSAAAAPPRKGCGLGFELALLLPLAAGLRRRRGLR